MRAETLPVRNIYLTSLLLTSGPIQCSPYVTGGFKGRHRNSQGCFTGQTAFTEHLDLKQDGVFSVSVVETALRANNSFYFLLWIWVSVGWNVRALLSAPGAGLLCSLSFSTPFEEDKNEICGCLDSCFTLIKAEIAGSNAFLAKALCI